MQQAGIAAIAADCFDRKIPLVSERQGEEVARSGEGLGDKARLDPMVDDIKEADVAAGGADIGGDWLSEGLSLSPDDARSTMGSVSGMMRYSP